MAEKILVVEDDKGIAMQHKIQLKKLGLNVDLAYTEDEALQKLGDNPDMVATDIHLDDNDHEKKHGYEIARRAKGQGIDRVVIQSASTDPSQKVEDVDFVKKSELIDWVKKHKKG